MQWFENQLLKNLTDPSLIIMGNAPYHSMLLNRAPNLTSTTKAAIQDWLVNNNIDFTTKILKSELLRILAKYLLTHCYSDTFINST